MSSDKKHPLKTIGNFKQICSAQIEDTIPFYMYRSVKTGITVCIAEADGPFINGDFNIVTETCDNNGLPHAMQYLIFTGSKDDPYYNILKLWAMRSLANINAYSSQNCNCFTMRAAGSEGFLNLMPKYLDHILYPSLKDSAYLTEVHHITGKGNNGGVVYRVTQEKERTSDCIIHNKMLQALYPENCGYNSVVMGTTKNFRESTNNKKVKQFHEKFFRPENLTVMITGKIQLDKIFEALLPLEKKIMLKKRKDKFKRPWQTPIKPLTKSVEVEVLFPCCPEISDEISGKVHVAWRGPSPFTHVCDYRGCLLLLDYLIETSNSPLRKEFGELGNQLSITWDMSYWSDPYFEIIFKDIPIKHIDLITEKSIHQIFKILCIKGINMKTMKLLIHKLSFDYQIELNNNPHKNIAVFLFNYLIYGNTDNLKKQLNMLHGFKDLINKSETYFLTLLKDYFVDAPMVVVRGKPSSDTFLQLENEEKHVTEQTKALGEKYLKQKENELQEAKKKKIKNVPCEDLSKLPISGINSITFHHIKRYSPETAKQHPKLDVTQLPLFTYLTDVKTNFFYLHFIMDTSSISSNFYKLFVPLIMKIITESPIERGEQMIPYEEVKYLLFADNITVQSHIGINTLGHFPNSMSLILQAELHNYENSVQWGKELLYDTKLTVERLKVTIGRLLNNIELQGETVARSLMTTLLYPDDSTRITYNLLGQHIFLTDVQRRLNTEEYQKKVMEIIEHVRQEIISPNNMFVHMAVNVNKLTELFPNVYAPWKKLFSNCMNLEKVKVNITSNSKVCTPYNISHNGCIMGLEWIDSSYLIQTCPCIKDFQHSDLAALEVCLTYFKQQEGPIWKERPGLSKQFSLYTTVEDGYLTVKFCEAENVVTAYKTTQSIVKMHLDKTKWNQLLYENAKSSTILNYINNVQSIKHVINASLAFYCKNLPHDYINKMVRRVSAVTIKDMIRVTNLYIIPLFDPEQCKLAIACNNNKVDEIKKAFQEMKFTLKVYESVTELKYYIGTMNTK